MISPTAFAYNLETASDNTFMNADVADTDIPAAAAQEHAALVAAARAAGLHVHALPGAGLPDEVFPNNWVSSHRVMPGSGTPSVVVYPMAVQSRQAEVRDDAKAIMLHGRRPDSVWDMPSELGTMHALEGTGALVLDRARHIAYCAISARAAEERTRRWAARMGYRLVLFRATDAAGKPVYHTNVLLSVGATAAVVCAEAIPDEHERAAVLSSLEQGADYPVIQISREQMASFAGNVLQLRGPERPVWLMSQSAHDAFTGEQREILATGSDICAVPIPVIERIGGGSVRCTIAEVFE